MSTSQVLQLLCTLGKSSPDFLRSLYTFIRLDGEGEYSHNLPQPESIRLVNFLDEALDVIPVTDPLFRRCLRRLRLICGHHNVLPSSYTIREGLRKTNSSPVACGGFADVWEGTLEGGPVCIKVLRIESRSASTKNVLAPFYGEALVWKRLRHPNIVCFLGVTTTPLQIVSEWMPNGTLPAYLKANSSVDRMGLLLDVAEGVNYLHNCYMFHGDLKGPNILIDGNGHARVSDFGLASIAYGKYSSGTRSDKGRTVRWTAPEVLFGTVAASKQADTFAFGMVVVEVFTGNVPFHGIISTLVSFKTMNGERPPRPHGAEASDLSDALWKMTECCWKQDPKDRLGSSEVVALLREMYATSPTNPLVSAFSGTQGLAQSSSMTPQTDAALSPKLLDILQYRQPTHKRGLSDATPLNNGVETTADEFPGEPPSAVRHQTPSQYPANGMEQQFGGTDQDQNDQHFPQSFRSETLETVESDVWETAPSDAWPIIPTTLPQRNVNQVPETASDGRGTPESPVPIPPRISIHPVNSISSDTSSPGVGDPFDYQHFTLLNDVRTDRGALGSRNDAEGSCAGEPNGAEKPGLQRPRPPEQSLDGPSQSLPVHPALRPKPDLASPDLESMERTASRSSSIKKSIRTSIGGLLGALGLGGRSSKASTRSTTPTADRGDSKAEGDIPPRKTGGARKGSDRWARVRGVAMVMGLRKRA